jgi:hypothetical protein
MVTTMTDSIAFPRLRRLLVAAGVVLAAQAVAGTLLLSRIGPGNEASLGMVTFERSVLLQVYLRVGVVVLLAVLGASFLLLASRRIFFSYSHALTHNRHGARWIIFSLTSSITVFLVAQLNGITAIGTLVLIYAATSTMTLFSVLQERMPVAAGAPAPAPASAWPSMLPLSFGAAIGIVPWGIIAFQQIVGGIIGAGPSVAVRVITLLMLAAAFAFAVTQWREQRLASTGTVGTLGEAGIRSHTGSLSEAGIRGERTFIILCTVAVSVFAWAVLLLATLTTAVTA